MHNLTVEIEKNVFSLRDALEKLLENSENEALEKAAIDEALSSLQEHFSGSKYANVELLFQSAKALVEDSEAFGNGESEALLLRLCLLFEQLVETWKLGADAPKDYFNAFIALASDQALAAESEEGVNHASIKILRTLYQRELLALLRNQGVESAFKRLEGVVSDLIVELPIAMQSEWRTLQYYLTSIQSVSPIAPQTHQVLGLLDRKLAAVLRYKPLDREFLPELVSAVEVLPKGKKWLQVERSHNHIYVSAGVYSRLVDSIKDQIVALHESVERLYIDKNQISELGESIQFLDELHAVLHLMGFDKLSDLASSIALNFQAWQQNDNLLIDETFYDVVNYIWILEENLNQLWLIDDSEIPVTADDIEGWALDNANLSLNGQLSKAYEALHECLKSGECTAAEAVESFTHYIQIENLHAQEHPLLAAANRAIATGALPENGEALGTICVAFAYISSRLLSHNSISPSLIEEAANLLGAAEAPLSEKRSTSAAVVNEGAASEMDRSTSKPFDETSQTSDEITLEILDDEPIIEEAPVMVEIEESGAELNEDLLAPEVAFSDIAEEKAPLVADSKPTETILEKPPKKMETSILSSNMDQWSGESLDNLEIELDDADQYHFNRVDQVAEAPTVSDEELDESLAQFFDDIDAPSGDSFAEFDFAEADDGGLSVQEDPQSLQKRDDQAANENRGKRHLTPSGKELELELELVGGNLSDEAVESEQPMVSNILIKALHEETDELEEVFHENISKSRIGTSEIQELLRVAHTLKSNVKLIHLDEIFARLQSIESHLLTMKNCSADEKRALKDNISSIFKEVRGKIDRELAKVK